MPRSILVRYGVAAAAVGLVLVVKAPLEALVGPGPPLILFIPALTLSAWYGGFGPGMLTTALSVLVCNYYFFPPIGSLRLNSGYDLFQLGVFVVEGTLTSVLMKQLRDAQRLSEANATAALAYRDTLQLSEDALRRERDFAESLIAAAQAIVLVLDRQGRVLQFNPFLVDLTGRRPFEVQGADWFATFVPPDDRPRARAAFHGALADPEGAHVIHRVFTASEQPREVEWFHKSLPGDPRGVLTIGHDITELREAQQRALQAERLAAIGQMVTGLAHESRNALQRSQACLEMLVRRVDRPEALDLLTGIQEAQDDLHRLYEEVRNYAAPIILDRREWPLRDVLRDAWARLEPLRKGRIARLREHGAPAPSGAVDRFRLGQVFRNVLDNALAACQDPVEVDVDWTATYLNGKPAVCVAIADNGPGLTPEQRRNLFEPFFTTKTQGTGLGMAIAKRIVEAHGGTIEIGFGHGPGGRIVITLPTGNR